MTYAVSADAATMTVIVTLPEAAAAMRIDKAAQTPMTIGPKMGCACDE
jgi:hypothetical protein